jgi:hypothetical protein
MLTPPRLVEVTDDSRAADSKERVALELMQFIYRTEAIDVPPEARRKHLFTLYAQCLALTYRTPAERVI